jgi:hypothetical protein
MFIMICPVFCLKQRFGRCTLPPSSGKNYLEIETSSIIWAEISNFLPENGGRVQSPKRCFKYKTERCIRFKKSVTVLIYYRHEILSLV